MYENNNQQFNGWGSRQNQPQNSGYSNNSGWNAPSQPQQPQLPLVRGRVIQNEAEVRPNEVNMDGTALSVFPTMDGQFVLIKQWMADGTIRTIPYQLMTQQPEEPQADPYQVIMNQLLTMQGSINELSSALTSSNKKTTKTKQDTENSGGENK